MAIFPDASYRAKQNPRSLTPKFFIDVAVANEQIIVPPIIITPRQSYI